MIVYIIKRKNSNLCVRAGRRGLLCYNIDAAKRFTYLAQAQSYIDSLPDGDLYYPVKIDR